MNLRFLASLKQQATVSPHFQKSLSMLQASVPELRALIAHELTCNPALEYAEAQPEVDINYDDPAEPPTQSVDGDAGEDPIYDTVQQTASETEQFILDTAHETETLQQHLLKQMDNESNSAHDESIYNLLYQIIHSLDAQGYLRCHDFDNEPELPTVLYILSKLDPIGCGSRSLRECLLTQSDAIKEEHDIARKILCFDLLQDVARSNYTALVRRLGCSIQEVVDAIAWIKKNLNPIPARDFSSTVQPIMHDVIVIEEGFDGLAVLLNDDVIPRIKISNYIKEQQHTAQAQQDAVLSCYVAETLRSGRQFLSGLKERQRTILKVATSIVIRQQEFFKTGHLIPMQLSHVAKDVQFAISTVCRCVDNKWMQTPRGLFSFKHFFTEGLATLGGTLTSSQMIKDRIRALLEKHPTIKDEQLTQMLTSSGIRIARRTITKYRTEMRLQNYSSRKALANLPQNGTSTATSVNRK